MELDNKRLRNELATAIRQTEDYAKMKTILERQHQDLERERAIREQVQRARRERVEMSLQSAAVKFKSGGASGDDEDVGKALEQRKVNIVVEEPVS